MQELLLIAVGSAFVNNVCSVSFLEYARSWAFPKT